VVLGGGGGLSAHAITFVLGHILPDRGGEH
jgi:hypothetical protein